jgi:hypothetical protein
MVAKDPLWVQKITKRAETLLESAQAANGPEAHDDNPDWDRFEAMDAAADDVHELLELARDVAGLNAWIQTRVGAAYDVLYILINE